MSWLLNALLHALNYFVLWLRSLVVCYDKEVYWIWGWESEGKGRVCVGRVVCRSWEGGGEGRSEDNGGWCLCFTGRYSVKRVCFS